MTALESRRAADEIVKRWNEATGDKALPAELVISTNPALDAVLPGGFMPYYGYGAGLTDRFAFAQRTIRPGTAPPQP